MKTQAIKAMFAVAGEEEDDREVGDGGSYHQCEHSQLLLGGHRSPIE